MTAVATKILTDRINRIEVSATMAITAEALKMQASGIDMANFGAGEPHFSTPRHIKDAAIDAIEKNFSRYTNVAGVPEVRKAVVERHAADFGTSSSSRCPSGSPTRTSSSSPAASPFTSRAPRRTTSA